MRPIRHCAKCGEYVADCYVSTGRRPNIQTKLKLVHISGDGAEIFRNHEPVGEDETSA